MHRIYNLLAVDSVTSLHPIHIYCALSWLMLRYIRALSISCRTSERRRRPSGLAVPQTIAHAPRAPLNYAPETLWRRRWLDAQSPEYTWRLLPSLSRRPTRCPSGRQTDDGGGNALPAYVTSGRVDDGSGLARLPRPVRQWICFRGLVSLIRLFLSSWRRRSLGQRDAAQLAS